MTERLVLRNIVKEFPGVRALDGVSLTLRSGEVHALMGENGAGKSTLIKVLTGVYRPDGGEILMEGQPIRPVSPEDAVRHGISTVYQEVNLSPNLSVAECVCLGREPRTWRGIDWRTMAARARTALARMGIDVDVNRPLSGYSIAIQQMVAIARALDVSAQVLVLDEPTSSLDRTEVGQLFDVLRKLRADGLAIVFVTHFLDQVYELSDRMTILRNGTLVGEYLTAELPKRELVAKMIGQESAPEYGHKVAGPNNDRKALLKTQGLGRRGTVHDVSISVKPGEVLGFAGLLGSGRTETLRLLFGVDRGHEGQMSFDERPVSTWSCSDAIANGLGLCPEDRKVDGIFPDLSVRENMMVVLQSRRSFPLPLGKQRQLVDEFIRKLRIATPDADKPFRLLSGGNQQKVLLARWLLANPRLLLLDEPTRGIDVGAKFEIAALIEELRETGMAFIFVSSELEEVVRSCDRVAIFRDRHMVGEVEGEAVREDTILNTIAGGAA